MFYINTDLESKERYDMAKFSEYLTDNFDILNSYFVHKLKSLAEFGQYAVQAEEERAELISFKIYGSTQYWWLLLLYNDLTAWEQLTAGLTLKYPSITSLEDLYFSLNTLENTR